MITIKPVKPQDFMFLNKSCHIPEASFCWQSFDGENPCGGAVVSHAAEPAILFLEYAEHCIGDGLIKMAADFLRGRGYDKLISSDEKAAQPFGYFKTESGVCFAPLCDIKGDCQTD